MKKSLCRVLLCLGACLGLLGCSPGEDRPLLPDNEIVEAVLPYLDGVQEQEEGAAYLEDTLGISPDQVSHFVLYTGDASQTTTFFLILTLKDSGGLAGAAENVEQFLQERANAAQQGDLSGCGLYALLPKGNKLFAIMHQDEKTYRELVGYISDL